MQYATSDTEAGLDAVPVAPGSPVGGQEQEQDPSGSQEEASGGA